MTKIKYMGGTPVPGLRNYPLQVWDQLFGGKQPALDSDAHLNAVMQWLCRAHDAGGDGGVARMYHIRRGWGASYPETTGYAIPTFLDFAKYSGNDDFASRALRMADWESDVQMESGAVQGGVITDKATPAIFNTGQVLFGWRAAYLQSGHERFKQSALRAADYLVEQMDVDGAWRKNLSEFCSADIDTFAYNVRSAWALLLADELAENSKYRESAIRNAQFVLSLCHENGWIDKNCLSRPEQPLLHTIAYAFQGMLEIAAIETMPDVLGAVERGNRALLNSFKRYGQLHGRYEENWIPTVRWRCLTGEAQTAIVWQRLADVTGGKEWRDAAAQLIRQIKMTQTLLGDPGRAGGVKGSQPITGPYGRLEYPNWAAKFFADALMLEVGVAAAREG